MNIILYTYKTLAYFSQRDDGRTLMIFYIVHFTSNVDFQITMYLHVDRGITEYLSMYSIAINL